LLAVLCLASSLAAQDLKLPNKEGSVKFVLIGDTGTGSRAQSEVGAQMEALRKKFPFTFVLMAGDNMYGSQRARDFVNKFEKPYEALLSAGVKFFAAIGNHDEAFTINYPPLNMGGRRYYTFVRSQVRFLVLDTNVMDAEQLRWFEETLKESPEPWKIAYFHHPLYGNAGRHGSAADMRVLLEPLLVRYGVTVVFSGHDHVYERLVPQRGITYFVAGSGGKLRKGDLQRTASTAAGFDQDQAFVIAEIEADTLYFQTITRTGATVDFGTIPRLTRSAGTN
jgi:3',5'-cyclic AMP phosphodiesterase CpdA